MGILNTIIWDINPAIFKLGPLEVRWYGLFFAISFLLGLQILTVVISM